MLYFVHSLLLRLAVQVGTVFGALPRLSFNTA